MIKLTYLRRNNRLLLRVRQSPLLVRVQTPGPGSYSVTDTDKYRKRCPQYSMTSRIVLASDEDSCKPGPGAHSPERVRVPYSFIHSFHVSFTFIYVRGVDPYGTGGTRPPIFGLGDIITNVPPIFLE